MSSPQDDVAGPINALYQQVNNNSQDIQDNTEIIQTKTASTVPTVDGSVAIYDGTDGLTIKSSNININSSNNIGVGTVNQQYQMDVRTIGMLASQIHVSNTDTDAGGYLLSNGDTSLLLTAGASYNISGGLIAKAAQAATFGAAFGALFFTSDGGLTPGNSFTTNEVLRVQALETSLSTNGLNITATSAYTRILYPPANIGAPTFSTRSAGAKIVLFPGISASTTDLGIGVENNTMWFGHFDATAARLFKWYGGTTEIMRLQGDGELLVKAGGATGFAKVGGVVQGTDHYADVNNSGTAETDLYSDTIPANALNNNGDKLTTTYQLQCTGAALASQDMRVYFGGTKIYDSGALSIGAITSNFTFEVLIVRVSASVVRCSVAVSSDFATLFPYSAYTEVTGLTLANTQILKITGQASGAGGASSQITAKLSSGINWVPEG